MSSKTSDQLTTVYDPEGWDGVACENPGTVLQAPTCSLHESISVPKCPPLQADCQHISDRMPSVRQTRTNACERSPMAAAPYRPLGWEPATRTPMHRTADQR